MRLHVEASGPEDGTPVVFLHGASGSMGTYAWLTGAITEGRRIVRIDLRGHGRSEHVPGAYDVDDYGEDVVGVLREQVGRPAVLVGHSLQMDPGVLEGAADRSTLAPTDTTSPVAVPVLVLGADDEMGSAFPARHAERMAISHPDVQIVRVPGAGHGIHDERDHRGDYVEALARFLATHA